MAEIYYQDASVTIYHADSTDTLSVLVAGSVDLVLTDPPYNVSDASSAIRHADGSLAQRRDFGAWDYRWDPTRFLAGSLRVVRDGGSLVTFTSDRLLAAYIAAAGWGYRATTVWIKPNAPPNPRRSYQNAVEFIAWLAKGIKSTWNGGATTGPFFYPLCAGHERTEHPTQKPLRLIKDLLRLHSNPGDLVLDPYAGSGTTGRAAKDMGRRAILIEQDERYCEIAATRLAQQVLDLDHAA